MRERKWVVCSLPLLLLLLLLGLGLDGPKPTLGPCISLCTIHARSRP